MGVNRTVVVNVSWERRDGIRSKFRATANDILEHLSEERYPEFWRWFHMMALRGEIGADPIEILGSIRRLKKMAFAYMNPSLLVP